MTQDLFDRLSQPFPPELVSWRVGSTNKEKTKGMALAFINARDVMARFDAVCGPAGWERRHPHVGGTTTCEIAIWIEGRGWVVKCDGAGDTDVEAEKGSLSDSFKRAAVNWGVGRYLYDLDAPWVAIEPFGRSYKIKASELRTLAALLRGKGGVAPVEQAKANGRKPAAQAKRDGDNEKIKAEIGQLDKAGLADWHANFDQNTAHLPLSWLDPVRDMLELRLEELNEPDAARDLDRQFAQTMGAA